MSETTEPGTALAVMPPSAVSVILKESDKARDILSAIADKVNAYKPDISTPKGRKECASIAAEVATAKMDLIRIGKGMTEGWRKSTSEVNAECKIIEERMDELKQQVRRPLTEFENAEKARVAAHETELARIAGLVNGVNGMSSDEINVLLDSVTEYDTSSIRWEEFTMRAKDLIAHVDSELRAALTAACKREQQAAELARLQAAEAEREAQEAAQRQAAREEQIALQAATNARLDAEIKAKAAEDVARRAAAEAERVAAEKIEAAERAADKAERDRVAAVERAERDRITAIEAERARVAKEAAEAQKEADKRAANVAHRRRINNELLADLRALELEEARAKSLITAIAKGDIRHLTIGY